MKQNIPKALNVIIAFIAKLVRGLDLFELLLGVKQNTKTAVQADLDAAEKAQAEAQDAKTARNVALANRDAADLKVITFIGVLRELFKPKFGTRYSQAWNKVGFLNNSLAVPPTMDGRVGLVRAAQLYLDAHPELEIPGVLTADIAGDVYTEAVTASSDLGIAQTTLRQKMAARDAANLALQQRARAVCRELKQLLPANDPRWLEFGFNVPGDVSVPSAPTALVVTPGLPGNLAASWESPVNSDRFRIYRKVVGVDTDFASIHSTAETAFNLSGLTSGSHVQMYVTALNAAGESLPSETVEVVVP